MYTALAVGVLAIVLMLGILGRAAHREAQARDLAAVERRLLHY